MDVTGACPSLRSQNTITMGKCAVQVSVLAHFTGVSPGPA
jgi:hypothetical protein